MKNYDLTPFWKSTIGFDQLFNLMQNDARRFAGEPNYPPYNIERTGEDTYTVALALAGFDPDEIFITVQQNVLTVEGEKQEKSEHTYLYQGISSRPFRREFNLADHVEVKGARWDNGLLQIELAREIPQEMKPHRIAIETGTAGRQALTGRMKKAA